MSVSTDTPSRRDRAERVLEAVALAAERFLSGASWEESLEEVLGAFGRATGVDRVYLHLLGDVRAPGNPVSRSWHTPEGGLEELSGTARLPPRLGLFARWRLRLEDGMPIYGRVEDLPADEREVLAARGVRSFAAAPVAAGDEWLGFLMLEDGDRERSWSTIELEALRTAARTFSAAIQRQRAEAALASTDALYRDLLENASDLVLSASPEGAIQLVNRAWKEALGYDDEEISRLEVWDFIHDDHHERWRHEVDEILGGTGQGRLETVFVTKEGEEIIVEGRLDCRIVDRRPTAVRGIFRDITERKMIDRLKQEFVSTVSHELRTPLTSIIASLQLIERGCLDEPRAKELQTVALRNSRRLLGLINDLLDVQKLAANKMVFQSEPVDVWPLLTEAAAGMRGFAESLEVELRVPQGMSPLPVLGDRLRLLQVLHNLVSNAIKFSPRGDVVVLGAAATGDRVRLSVRDHGPGIPEEFHDRLFEKFTQLDASPTRRAGGSGLGLSIVKGLVEGMHGRILVATPESGDGTVFHVELPAA